MSRNELTWWDFLLLSYVLQDPLCIAGSRQSGWNSCTGCGHCVCRGEVTGMAVLPSKQLHALLSCLLHVHFKRVHLQCSC